MTLLIFLRHGEGDGVAGRCIGHTDVPLSKQGADSIRRVVENGIGSLCEGYSGKIRLVSSDLSRATASAAIVASLLGLSLEIDSRLRELDFGAWDGHRWSVIERTDPVRFQSWMDQWTELAPPDGESVTDILGRAAAWIADAAPQDNDGCCIVVSHAGWIRAALTQLFAMEPARFFDFRVEYAHATIVDVSSAGATLVARNVDRFPLRTTEAS
jgi:broad specificity phosphatase PhoE